MIYASVESIQENLEKTSDSLPEYSANHVFAEGYDTAIDVMTCVNSASIWHKPENKPEGIGNVLLALEDTREIIVGWWGYGNWHNVYYGLIEEERVMGWAYMPDFPDDEIGE